MVLTILSFEFRQRLRRASTYVYFLVFVAMGCFFGAIAGGSVVRASEISFSGYHWNVCDLPGGSRNDYQAGCVDMFVRSGSSKNGSLLAASA